MRQARAAGHGTCDPDDGGIGLGETDQGVAEDILIVRGRSGSGFQALAGLRIKGAQAVKSLGMAHGRLQSPAFLGDHVKEDGAVRLFGKLEILDQLLEIVAVDRSEITKAELLEERRLDKEVLRFPFPLHVHPVHVVPAGQRREELLQVVVNLVVGRVGREPVEVLGDGSDIFRDRPLVVVEDHNQAFGRGDDIVQGLQGDTAGEGGIAADGDDVFPGAQQVAGARHAERRAEGGAGVAGTERIMRTFVAHQEPTRSSRLAQLAKEFSSPSGEQLVRISLMGDVEDERVGRRVEHPVECEGQLDHPQIGADVAAVLCGDKDDLRPNFGCELCELRRGQALHVRGLLNGVEQTRSER